MMCFAGREVRPVEIPVQPGLDPFLVLEELGPAKRAEKKFPSKGAAMKVFAIGFCLCLACVVPAQAATMEPRPKSSAGQEHAFFDWLGKPSAARTDPEGDIETRVSAPQRVVPGQARYWCTPAGAGARARCWHK